MKRMSGVMLVAGMMMLCMVNMAGAYTVITHDFRDQLDGATTSFEGLAFTDDGTLWITSAPNFQQTQLLSVDIETDKVMSAVDYQSGWFDVLNPVGLASDGENLLVASNRKGGWFGDLSDYVYQDVNNLTGDVSDNIVLSTGDCVEAEGAAYANGLIYVSCQDSQNVIGIDPATGAVVENISFDAELLGLAATDDGKLIVGDYTNHALLMYDLSAGEITQTIDLAELFADYEVEVSLGDIRNIPDPDGLAYRDGRIFMTFEHDLQVYEMLVTPEPGTMLLLGVGLIGLMAAVRRKRR
ncbi:MAG: PEP-CTERM sorting domain-containing protein [Desulfobacterales bacterium]|nr:PEP-CTERM sorting domain-containing protein [Desulfobacterales bacterium]